jgi:hypothetical protein
MAEFGKMKRKNSLGAPPSPSEASNNLEAPETAPATATAERVDLRTRKTHRVVPFATRITADLDQQMRGIAQRDNIKLVELLERAVEAYEKNQ